MRILVVVVDGLQPAFLGAYGNEWVATPFVDRWAAEGVVFDHHFADCPEPDAAHRAWRTGRHPFAPGTTSADLLAGLRDAAVRTARVGPLLTTDDPWASGWAYDLSAPRDTDDPLALKPTRRAVRQAIEALGDARDALLWVEIDALLPPWRLSEEATAEYFEEPSEDEGETDEEAETAPQDMLTPWTDPLPERIDPNDDRTFERLQRTYAAAVADLDVGLERLLSDCAKRGWGDDALWLLTSERGFPLGEHGAAGFDAAELHEELVHLPLLLRWPHARQAGLRVNTLTQPANLAPTLRELFGLALPTQDGPYDGRSLVPLARGNDLPLRLQAVSGLRRGERLHGGIRSAGWYLMSDGGVRGESWRLYVKPDDRWEVNDIHQHNLELTEEMERGLQEFWGPQSP
jgi:arylsulfatase A-like enzyme